MRDCDKKGMRCLNKISHEKWAPAFNNESRRYGHLPQGA